MEIPLMLKPLSTNILIRIDKKVEYERVMKLFDMLKQNKLTSFSLVALQKGKQL